MKKVLISSLLLLCMTPSLFAGEESESESLSVMEKIVQSNLGRDVAFSFHPKMLGMSGIDLDNFRIGENAEYLKEHPYLSPWAFSSERTSVRYNPFAIFLGRISLTEVEVINPQVQIALDARLRHNFEDILAKQKENRFSNWVRTHQVIVKNMHFNIYSELMFSQPIKYEVNDINVDIRNVIKGKVATVDISANTPGSNRQNVDIRGTVGPIVSIGYIEESPMDLQFRVKDAPMEFELANIPDSITQNRLYRRTLALPESGFANMSYDLVGDVWKKLDVTGNVRLDNIVMASIDKTLKGKPFNVTISSNTNISLNKQTSNIENVSIDINGSQLILDGQINQILDNPEANLYLRSNTINLAEFNDIYPFISDIYKIKLNKGTTQLDLKTSGNLEQGLALNGFFKTNDMQLSSLKNGRRGKTLNSSLELTKPIIYYARDNKLSMESMDLKIANSVINMSGGVDDLTLIDRKLKVTVKSDALDITAMHEFAPFYDEYLPDELIYKGFFSFKALFEGNLNQATINGKADFSRLNFSIKNFARKPGRSRFDVDYSGKFNEDLSLDGEASFVWEKGEFDNSVIFIESLSYLLGKPSEKSRQYMASIDPNQIHFEKASGKISIIDNTQVKLNMNIKGISNSKQKQVDMNLSGKIGIEKYDLQLSGEIQIPRESYKEILSINPDAKRYLSKDGAYLVLPLKLQGTISNPKLSLNV